MKSIKVKPKSILLLSYSTLLPMLKVMIKKSNRGKISSDEIEDIATQFGFGKKLNDAKSAAKLAGLQIIWRRGYETC